MPRFSPSMKGPSLSRHTSTERARTAYGPIRSRALGRCVSSRTFHIRISEPLTYSFNHLFELTVSSASVRTRARANHGTTTRRSR